MARVPLASVLAVARAASACGGGSPSPAAPVSVSPVGATVNGTVLTAESVSTVSVEGTALTAAVDGTRRFQLRAVPTGNVRLVFSGPVDRSAVTLSNVQDQEVIEVDVAISGPTATLQREVRSGVVTPTAVGSVTIKKYTNGQDADQTPGPTIPVGGPVTWTYVVTNGTTGTLESLTVVDVQ